MYRDTDTVWVVGLNEPQESCVRWGSRFSWEGVILRGKEWPVVKYSDTLPLSVQKQLK